MSRPAAPRKPDKRDIHGGSGGVCPYQPLNKHSVYLTIVPSTARKSADTIVLLSRVLSAVSVRVHSVFVLKSTNGREYILK